MKKLLPAHLPEARLMASKLAENLMYFGFTLQNTEDDENEISQEEAMELFAKAIGYDNGWDELAEAVTEDHEPVYFDKDPAVYGDQITEVVLKVAKEVGLDYAHGKVFEAVQGAGIGLTPSEQRNNEEGLTPWGVVIDTEILAEGIEEVETGGHGGWVLSEERQKVMPEHLVLDEPYYEEDCNWALVAIAFCDEFLEHLPGALGVLDVYSSNSVPRNWTAQLERMRELGYESVKKTEDLDLGELICHASPYDAIQYYAEAEGGKLNRDINQDEENVVEYLAECVRMNSIPAAIPEGEYPTLQEWVAVLTKVPKLNGRWPKKKGPWKEHWMPGLDLMNTVNSFL